MRISTDREAGLQQAQDVIRGLNQTFASGKTKPYQFRIQQLKNLLRFLDDNSETLCSALWKDLRKPRHECMISEIDIVKNEIRSALANLKEWMDPHPVEKTLATAVDFPYIRYEPYGTVLVIGAWNYPVNLLLSPLVGALAAGNCVILKPSELAPQTEITVERLLSSYLDKDCYEVICGGPEETSLLLKEKFDYIFYTGSTNVGKIVYEAAAKHLTPVTLELGGKSPCFVDSNADMQLTAKRIMWGKIINAGQTCIAPDYVLCTPETQKVLVNALKNATSEMLTDPKGGDDYCRIVNSRHFDRLEGLVKQQHVAFGGEFDAESKYISPTVLTNVDPESAVMKQEIFGPVLPIVPVSGVEEAIGFVNKRDKPLAIYVFSKDKKYTNKILEETTSGGVCVNDVIMHFAVDSLPFGGVGASGLGAYHGFFSFGTFSHKRAVLWKKHGLDFLLFPRYPPYSDFKIKATQMLLKYRRPLPKWLGTVFIFGAGALSGYILRVILSRYFTLRFLLKNAYKGYKILVPGKPGTNPLPVTAL